MGSFGFFGFLPHTLPYENDMPQWNMLWGGARQVSRTVLRNLGETKRRCRDLLNVRTPSPVLGYRPVAWLSKKVSNRHCTEVQSPLSISAVPLRNGRQERRRTTHPGSRQARSDAPAEADSVSVQAAAAAVPKAAVRTTK
ncbi:uncharacterized protein FN964_008721 isoform 1-T1 [Alca torda]